MLGRGSSDPRFCFVTTCCDENSGLRASGLAECRAMALMQLSREKLWMMIGASYAAITAFAASLLYQRHLNELRYPDMASSGMNAAGDALTVIFLSFLYMIPTVFVLRLLSENIRLFEVYSHALLGLSITAIIALGVVAANWWLHTRTLEDLALLRLFGGPMVLIVMGVSRWAARSAPAKRSIDFALLAESLSLAALVAMLFVH